MFTIFFIIFGIVVIGGILFLAIYSFIHRRNLSFEGVVLEKIKSETVDMNQPDRMVTRRDYQYSIRVKKDNGKEIKYLINPNLYDKINVGDRVSKPKGTTTVSIIN